MCEVSEVSELSRGMRSRCDGASLRKGRNGWGGSLSRGAGNGSVYLVRLQPVQLFVKFDIFGSFLGFGGPSGGGRAR